MFKNFYNNRVQKEEFYTIQKDKTEKTDQSQITSASISAMAQKFGIDAIIAKAQQKNIESEQLKQKLYGHDFSKMFTSREELLNTKNNLNRLFEMIPARIRKEEFNDNVINFVNAYTTNDERKLKALNKLGIISDKQIADVQNYNANKRAQELEIKRKEEFIAKLENMKEGLYEDYKQTGNININFNQNNTPGNKDVQTSI